MEYTIRKIISKTGRKLEQTDYVDANPEMLNFRLISGEHYTWKGDKLRFKESADVMDFEQTVKEFPALAAVKYKSCKKFPYFTDNLSLIRVFLTPTVWLNLYCAMVLMSCGLTLSSIKKFDIARIRATALPV